MKKILALGLGAALLVALLFTIVVASGCGGSTDPSQKIDQAITKSGDIKSGHVDYDLKLDIKGDASALGSEFKDLLPMSLGMNGGVDFAKTDSKTSAKGNIKFDGLDAIISSLASSQGAADAQTTLGLGMISSFLSDMQFVLLDKTMYLKLAGNWYKTDASSVGDIANVGGAAASAGNVDAGCIQNAIKDTSKFGSAKIMSDLQDVGKETINGTEAEHIKANLNLDGAMTATADAMRSCGDAEAAGGLEAGKSELNSMFKTKAVEMWIDNDNNLVKVMLDVQLDPKAISDAASSLGGTTGSTGGAAASGLDSIGITMTLTMSNLNQDMNITKPEGNIMNLGDLFGGSSGLDGTGSGNTSTSTTGTSTSSGTSTRGSGASTNPSSY